MTNSTEPKKKELKEWQLYLCQIPGLWAGRKVPVADIKRPKPADISLASEDELTLLIDLAKHQLISLTTQLEQIRQRAQFLFSTQLLIMSANFALLPTIATEGNSWSIVSWLIFFAVIILSVLGAAGIILNRKVMGVVDSGWVTHQSRPWLLAIAQDYVDSVQPSWATVATQVTLLRDSALLTLIAFMGICATWLYTVV